jgi:PHD/YefM family antitoxin component YafN of YafNO toxin-antitoxin module
MQVFRSQDMQKQAAVLQEAAMVEPVMITYHDRPRLVLMSMQEYDRLRGRSRKAGRVTELPETVARGIEALADTEQAEPAPGHEEAHGPRP